MPRDKNKYVSLTPKTESGKIKLSYHGGEKWVLRDTKQELKFSRIPGPYLVLRSRDGSDCLFVRKSEDPDFTVRYI